MMRCAAAHVKDEAKSNDHIEHNSDDEAAAAACLWERLMSAPILYSRCSDDAGATNRSARCSAAASIALRTNPHTVYTNRRATLGAVMCARRSLSPLILLPMPNLTLPPPPPPHHPSLLPHPPAWSLYIASSGRPELLGWPRLQPRPRLHHREVARGQGASVMHLGHPHLHLVDACPERHGLLSELHVGL